MQSLLSHEHFSHYGGGPKGGCGGWLALRRPHSHGGRQRPARPLLATAKYCKEPA